MIEQVYTLSEAAEHLKIGLRTLRRYVDLGHVQVVRLGANVRVRESELLRVIRDGVPQ